MDPGPQQGAGKLAPASASAAAHRYAGQGHPDPERQAAARLQDRDLGERPAFGARNGAGVQGRGVRRQSRARRTLCRCRQGRSPRRQGHRQGAQPPNGFAFKDGTLFVAERERVIRFDDIENHLDSPPAPQVVIDGLPQQPNHFWKYLTLGPDGWLYFNQGAPFNIGLPNYLQASILRVNPETKVLEQYAQGVRNSVGLAFHPVTHELWFTDNGRDWLGDDSPSDELNRATHKGEHFGYPFCHQGDTLDLRQVSQLQGVHAAGGKARPACGLAGIALLYRQDVPGGISQQPLHRRARFVEPYQEERL
jgi:glucose/arabinose dehydrogenase